MVENSKNDNYHAVSCRNCGLPVVVPEKTLARARSRFADDSPESEQPRSSMLNLRCHACEREYVYNFSDVKELEGTPWSERARVASAKLVRSNGKLARAATA
jgi:ribosomal protein S27E